MQDKLSVAADNLSKEFEELRIKLENERDQTIRENGEEITREIQSKTKELQEVISQLNDFKTKRDMAIEEAKREEEKKLQEEKYKINLTEIDLDEIKRLREIIPFFRDSRAISKIIWESYYRNNTNDLIARVLGSAQHTGIYKLTNLLNQKTYIGQAADIKERWRDHVKAGLGIDTPNNKLYKAMLKYGVENFSFELVEDCDRSLLNDRETFWINYYRSQEFGYNMTKGGARS